MTIPPGWTVTRLGSVAHVVHGWPFKSEHYVTEGGDLPVVVAIGNFDYAGGFRFETSTIKRYTGEYPPEYALAPGDLLLVMTCQTDGGEILGVPGRVPEDDQTYLHNQRIGRVVIDHPELLDKDFAFHLARSTEFNRQLCITASGSKILHTSPGRIEATLFGRPPLYEQLRIAQVLGALDDKIDANASLAMTANELAAQVVRVASPASVLLSEIAVHHRRSVTPEEMGPAPVWHYSLPAFDAGRAPWLDESRSIKSSKFTVAQPSVLVSKLNPRFPRIWDVPTVRGPLMVASTEFLVLESRYSSSTVLWAALSQPEFSVQLQGKAAGTSGSHQRVRPVDLLGVRVPDVRELGDVAKSQITALGYRAGLCISESGTLVAMRDVLLPQLISGRIRVKDVEQTVGEAV